MKILSFIIVFLVSSIAFASVEQCPDLTGKFFCKGIEGSHKDMVMEISQEASKDGVMNYHYLYLQEGEAPLNLSFLASDQGVANPSQNGMIGKCFEGYYFNSKDGQVTEKTLFNFINEKGEYVVMRNKDHELFLVCPKH